MSMGGGYRLPSGGKKGEQYENIGNDDRSPEIATRLAVHLVSHVLNEACIIINATKDFGLPLRDVSNTRKINDNLFNNSSIENLTFTVEMGDNDDISAKNATNAMTTSTPQKPREIIKRNLIPDAHIIGQGDEDISNEFQEQNDLNRSTSTYINRLFDMSDVEYIIDGPDETQKEKCPTVTLNKEIHNIIESCIESAIDVNPTQEVEHTDETVGKSQISANSSYSLLNDAYSNEFVKNIAFYIDDDVAMYSGVGDRTFSANDHKKTVLTNEILQPIDVITYENAFATLNRDCEQYSDDEESVKQELVSLALQEVELADVNKSVTQLPTNDKMEYSDIATTSAVSASAVSRKSGLVRRCRIQGARLLSCLRGWWWRRKFPGRSKEPHKTGTVRGQCPLTPSARQRAASFLDPRLVRSPSPSRRLIWKFNTINETMISSAEWKGYAFEMKPDCDGQPDEKLS